MGRPVFILVVAMVYLSPFFAENSTLFAENAINGSVISTNPEKRASGVQINVYIPDYGYLVSVITHDDGQFEFKTEEFPDADNVILNPVSKNGETFLIAPDSCYIKTDGCTPADLKGVGYTVEIMDKFTSYSELMSILPGVEVDEDVAKFNRTPIEIYVNGYLWPLSYDEHKHIEYVREKEPIPAYKPPMDGINPFKIVVNPSNPVRFSDFRGDNMRTLKPTPTKVFIQYKLSILEEFCPIGLIGKASFVSPEELYEKYGVKSDSGIVMLWTDPEKAVNKPSRSLLILKKN